MRQPKDIPLLLRGPLIRSFMRGEKTVTRRTDLRKWSKAQPGDRIWFKETFATTEQTGVHPSDAEFVYKADDGSEVWADEFTGWKWKPSIFMPKVAARCWAVIEEIREEDLDEISWDDLRREGIACPEHDFPGGFCVSKCQALAQAWPILWDSINGKKPGLSSAENPTVARIQFRRIEGP